MTRAPHRKVLVPVSLFLKAVSFAKSESDWPTIARAQDIKIRFHYYALLLGRNTIIHN